MTATPPTPTYYYKVLALLQPGELVRRGNWGRVIYGYGPSHSVFYREYVFEAVRNREFAALPSRMESSFVFLDEAVARNWSRGMPRPELTYAVHLADPLALNHEADMGWFDSLPDCHSFEEVEEVARRYWRGDPHPTNLREVVAASDLVILRRL